jgi:hypothetical protein
MRRTDSARGGAQHTRYSAGLENAYDAFDDQTASPTVDLGALFKAAP